MITACEAITVATVARITSAGRSTSGAMMKNQSWSVNGVPVTWAWESLERASAPWPR